MMPNELAIPAFVGRKLIKKLSPWHVVPPSCVAAAVGVIIESAAIVKESRSKGVFGQVCPGHMSWTDAGTPT